MQKGLAAMNEAVRRLDEMLAANLEQIDFVTTVIVRGSEPANGMRETLTRLEAERGDLLDEREALVNVG
jgi:hypothetical protein